MARKLSCWNTAGLPSLDICFGVPYVSWICKLAPNWWMLFFHVVSYGKFSLKVLTPQPGWMEYFFSGHRLPDVPAPATLPGISSPPSSQSMRFVNELDQVWHVLVSVSFLPANFGGHRRPQLSAGVLTCPGGQQYWVATSAKSLFPYPVVFTGLIGISQCFIQAQGWAVVLSQSVLTGQVPCSLLHSSVSLCDVLIDYFTLPMHQGKGYSFVPPVFQSTAILVYSKINNTCYYTGIKEKALLFHQQSSLLYLKWIENVFYRAGTLFLELQSKNL